MDQRDSENPSSPSPVSLLLSRSSPGSRLCDKIFHPQLSRLRRKTKNVRWPSTAATRPSSFTPMPRWQFPISPSFTLCTPAEASQWWTPPPSTMKPTPREWCLSQVSVTSCVEMQSTARCYTLHEAGDSDRIVLAAVRPSALSFTFLSLCAVRDKSEGGSPGSGQVSYLTSSVSHMTLPPVCHVCHVISWCLISLSCGRVLTRTQCSYSMEWHYDWEMVHFRQAFYKKRLRRLGHLCRILLQEDLDHLVRVLRGHPRGAERGDHQGGDSLRAAGWGSLRENNSTGDIRMITTAEHVTNIHIFHFSQEKTQRTKHLNKIISYQIVTKNTLK